MQTDRSTRSTSMPWVRRLGIAALAAAAMATAPAWAAPYVTNWDFDVTTTFASATNDANHAMSILNGGTLLCWGTPADGYPQVTAPCTDNHKSALQIKPSNEHGSVLTVEGMTVGPGDVGYATLLTHYNNPITGNSLSKGSLQTSITLTPTNPAGSSYGPINNAFSINFTETTNSGTCAAPPQSNPCSDIFTIGTDALNKSFEYDGLTYYLHFFTIGQNNLPLPALLPGECAVAGADVGCSGFITEEAHKTPMRFGFAISTIPFDQPPVGVPEPSDLGIMGLGVLGIGIAIAINRRRNRREA